MEKQTKDLRKKVLKEARGITLISLMVTIIVLLILAGVSLNLIGGKKGILTRSKASVTEHKKAVAKEEMGIAWAALDMQYITEWSEDSSSSEAEIYTEENLNNELKEKGTVSNLQYNSNGNSTLTYTKGEIAYQMIITPEGEVILEGEEITTPTDPSKPTTPTTPTTPTAGSVTIGGEKITKANLGKYLGRSVGYTTSETVKDSATTYRLFYIDYDNKYGDGAGTIYLKADYATKTYSIPLATEATEKNKYLQLNPTWKNKEGAETAVSSSSNANLRAVAWMMEPSNWSALATSTEGITAKYVVGAPSLDMYVDSYNAYADANLAGYKNLETAYAIDGHTVQGYLIGFAPNDFSNNNGEYLPSGTIFSSEHAGGMYNPGSGKWFWLASPSATSSDRVMRVYGSSSYVYCNGYSILNAFCPLVSLSSSVQLSFK